MKVLLPWVEMYGAFKWWARHSTAGEIVAIVQPLAVSGQCKWTGDIWGVGRSAWRRQGSGHDKEEDALIETDKALEDAGYKLADQKLTVML